MGLLCASGGWGLGPAKRKRAVCASPAHHSCARCYTCRYRVCTNFLTGLDGKRVLVTGGSGGIGTACVRAFAGEGARVVVHYHRGVERARELAAELGGDVPVLGADLTREDEVEQLFADTREALGGLDVCAAVAGV